MMIQLPVLLTMLRMVAGIIFIPLTFRHTPPILFITILCGGLASDVVDGVIARRFGTVTLKLRRLDTRVDLIFYGCATYAALVKVSFPISSLYPWLVAYFLLFLIRNAVDYYRYRASPSYHMWSGKLWSIAIFAHLLALFLGMRALFFLPLAFSFYAVNAVEGIVTSLVLSHPSMDIPSVWHALKLHRSTWQQT